MIIHVENSKFTIFDEFASPLDMGAGQIVSIKCLDYLKFQRSRTFESHNTRNMHTIFQP